MNPGMRDSSVIEPYRLALGHGVDYKKAMIDSRSSLSFLEVMLSNLIT